jgi:FeS assembly SUF system protein
MNTDYLQLETEITKVLKTIYDPEIPVNIFDLGLIYEILVDENKTANIKMTLTAPNCPQADSLIAEVYEKVGKIKGINKVNVKIVFDPPWDSSMLSDEARLDLDLL